MPHVPSQTTGTEMSNTTTPSLSAVNDALALRTVSSSTVGNSAGPHLRIDLPNMRVGIVVDRENWTRQTRTGLSLLLAPGGGAVFDWQLRLADGGRVCAGSIAAQCADAVADRVAAMVSGACGYFEEWDVCWYMHLLAAGVLDAEYGPTGGGCHNVTIALPHEYWLIFGSEGGEGGVGWSLSFDSDGSVADDYHVGPMDAFAVLVGELVRLFPQLDPRQLAVDTRVHRAGLRWTRVCSKAPSSRSPVPVSASRRGSGGTRVLWKCSRSRPSTRWSPARSARNAPVWSRPPAGCEAPKPPQGGCPGLTAPGSPQSQPQHRAHCPCTRGAQCARCRGVPVVGGLPAFGPVVSDAGWSGGWWTAARPPPRSPCRPSRTWPRLRPGAFGSRRRLPGGVPRLPDPLPLRPGERLCPLPCVPAFQGPGTGPPEATGSPARPPAAPAHPPGRRLAQRVPPASAARRSPGRRSGAMGLKGTARRSSLAPPSPPDPLNP